MNQQSWVGKVVALVCGMAMTGVVHAYGEDAEAKPKGEPEGDLARPNAWQVEIRAGAGLWSGEATYSIGGQAWIPEEGFVDFPGKISELTFPVDVPYGLVGARMGNGRIEFQGSLMVNLSDPSDPVKDSDWDVLGDGVLDIYSESDAELDAVVLDGSARYWLRRIPDGEASGWGFGFGPGLYVAGFDWTVSQLDQWYPSHPEKPHEYESGRVATYQAVIVMAYLDLGLMARRGRWNGRMDLGVGPASVTDEDDHLLRQKISNGRMAGIGLKGMAEVRCDLSRSVFVAANMKVMAVEATGTQEQEGYGGELAGYYAEIDEDFSISSVTAGLDIGWRF